MGFSFDQKSHDLLRARDPDFLMKVFADANPYLLRVLAGRGVFGTDANDLVQQAWLTFFENIDRFEGKSAIRTFLCGILINKLHEFHRANARTTLEEDADKFYHRAFTSDGWWNHEPHDPYQLAHSKQMVAFIEDCLEGLSEQQRNAFVLKEAEQEESEDICNVLGVSISNLRVLIFRAKEKLRQCLEGKVHGEA